MNTSEFLTKQVELFKSFPPESVQQLVAGSREASFEAHEAIAHRGAEATHFGVVLDGTVSASVTGNGNARQPLGQLKAGGTFGEMALMNGDPLTADFIAESRCKVLLIPVSLFQSVIVANPAAVKQISRTITDRMKTLIAMDQILGKINAGIFWDAVTTDF